MIFVDPDVPMYLPGAARPNKDRAIATLARPVRGGERFMTDAAVYQEILDRHAAKRTPDTIDAAFERLDATADDILTFGMSGLRSARAQLRTADGISARDALHVAVKHKAGANRILSFDSGLATCPGIHRLG